MRPKQQIGVVPNGSGAKAVLTRLPSKKAPIRQRCKPLLGWLCSAFLASNALLAADAPPEVIAAAGNGLPAFLSRVPAGSKSLYGFAEDTDLSKVRLGSPLLLYTIKPSALSSNQVNDKVSGIASETSMWFFPLLADDEVKAMLVVDRQDSEWKAVSIGYGPLAAEWNQVARQWSVTRGFHPRLIAVFQVKRFYFTVPELNDRNLTPLLPSTSVQAAAKAPPSGPALNPARYSTLGGCLIETETLKPLLYRAGVSSGH